jgi:hypothetical protein
MSELKPCPFCGGYHVTNEGVTNKSIHCVDCGSYGPEPAYDAIEIDVDWNTRATPEVKALEWTDASWKNLLERRATNAICHYSVFFRPDDETWGAARWQVSVYDETEVLGHHFESEDQAKAAAQSHYEKLILEALE